MRLSAIIALISVTFISTAVSAQTANTKSSVKAAYGSRISGPEADPNNSGATGDRRITPRLDTRIRSRLQTRIERYAVAPDNLEAFEQSKDDGIRRADVFAPEPAVESPD